MKYGDSSPREGREEALYYFAAEGPGSYGMPGTYEEGYDFEIMEPAGWFAVVPGVDDVHWHVEEVALLDGHAVDMSEALPFDPGDTENTYALWCGDPIYPGYGNDWSEATQVTLGLPMSDSALIRFAYNGDFEGNDWDYFTVEVQGNGDWFEIYRNNIHSERVFQIIALQVSAYDLDYMLQAVRFQFQSDGAWSDQDDLFHSDIGAVWIDNVEIEVDEVTVLAEDFEDGLAPPNFTFIPIHDYEEEIYTALHTDVEIADPCWDETHTAWGFFDPDMPSEDYPDGVIPYGPPFTYLAVESPVLEVDQTGEPMNYRYGGAESFSVHIDGFFHLPYNGLVFMQYAVSARAAETGIFGPWECECGTIYFEEPVCLTYSPEFFEEMAFASAGGTELTLTGLKVRIFLEDMCIFWGEGCGEEYHPHTVGVLIDQVRLVADVGTGVEESPEIDVTHLYAAYPNPFNPRTDIRFELAEAGTTTLAVYDAAGRHVRTLIRTHLDAGEHSSHWDGLDDRGRAMPSGVFFLRLESPTGLNSQKIILAR